MDPARRRAGDESSAHTDGPGALVAGRYRIGEEIGRGGAGVVYRARDLVANVDVAVKVFLPGAGAQAPRVRREVSALRLLRLLGVVGLLDEGATEGWPFLVMEFVTGTPFPGVGRARTWDSLAPVVERFLEALARVHAAGVLHRDLKPSNVLVDAEGRPTILDFGLSWGPSLGASVTEPGTIVGTLNYLAPEQLLGQPVDARADLYAAGVMLYETLTGRLPHEADSLHTLIQQRTARMPLPVRRLQPDVPPHVAQVVDEMLLPRQAERPVSAGEVLRRLFDRAPGAVRRLDLPRLGGRASLDALVEAARARRSADVSGPRGSGRTRLVADAVEELRRDGRTAHWTLPGSRPFESLNRLAGDLEDLGGEDLASAQASIDARISAALAAGTVLVADDADRIDRWTSAALERCRGAGTVIRVLPPGTPAAIETRLFAETDLRELFAGPDRVLHLREDSANEMWLRTGGIAARVEAELAAWVRNGIAYARDGIYVVRRAALDSIRGSLPLTQPWEIAPGGPTPRSSHAEDLVTSIALAWPHSSTELVAQVSKLARWMVDAEIVALEKDGLVRRLPDGRVQPLVVPQAFASWPPERRAAVHAAVASALPAGSASRFRHLLASGDAAGAADEAVVAADALTRIGDTASASVVLQQALAGARETQDVEREGRLLVEYAKTSLSEGAVLAIDQAIYEFGRLREKTPHLASVESLLRGAADAARGNGEAALVLLDACGAFDDPDLELWRHAQRHRAARSLPLAREEEVVLRNAAWAASVGTPRALASAASWRGQFLYRQGRYGEAAEQQRRAAEQPEARVPARLRSLFNAAAAFIEAGCLLEAAECARHMRVVAVECRHHVYEARAEQTLRTVDYRLGRTGEVDRELVNVVAVLGDPALEAAVCLTEASVAWRVGTNSAAIEFATRAARNWQVMHRGAAATLARSLAIAAGAPFEDAEWQELASRAADCPLPGISVQALGLLLLAAPARRAGIEPKLAQRSLELPAGGMDTRREVASPKEALEWARSAT